MRYNRINAIKNGRMQYVVKLTANELGLRIYDNGIKEDESRKLMEIKMLILK